MKERKKHFLILAKNVSVCFEILTWTKLQFFKHSEGDATALDVHFRCILFFLISVRSDYATNAFLDKLLYFLIGDAEFKN